MHFGKNQGAGQASARPTPWSRDQLLGPESETQKCRWMNQAVHTRRQQEIAQKRTSALPRKVNSFSNVLNNRKTGRAKPEEAGDSRKDGKDDNQRIKHVKYGRCLCHCP